MFEDVPNLVSTRIYDNDSKMALHYVYFSSILYTSFFVLFRCVVSGGILYKHPFLLGLLVVLYYSSLVLAIIHLAMQSLSLKIYL